VKSDAEARPRDEEAAQSEGAADGVLADGASADVPDEGSGRDAGTAGPTDAAATDEDAGRGRKRRARRGSDDGDGDGTVTRSGPSLPLVPVLAVLLALLVAGGVFLWLTRPDPSRVRTDDYVAALTQARSNVVDMTSWDYLTLDDDIEQIRRVTTGDLRDQAVQQLDSQRKVITEAKTVVNTEVVSAGVTRADDEKATVVMVIQSTQEGGTGEQAQVNRYQIQVDLVKKGERWLLSAITGAGQP
jgi:hypothetical protein